MRTVFSWALATLLTTGLNTAGAQQCNDFNQCTVNDQCREGECTGTPQSGGSCDDGNDCTVNDQCGPGGTCAGTDAPVGTPCQGGCGTCQQLVPIPGVPLQCLGDVANNGRSCDAPYSSPCFPTSCQVFGVPGFPSAAICLPHPVECPSSGSCTGVCNPNTGQCDNSISLCDPRCERCNQGQCVPANQGAACDDYDECTAQSRCETIDLSEAGLGIRGICRAGEATGGTPTPTGPEPEETPTPTPVAPPTPGACVGDCNGDGEVFINELITGVNIALGSAQLGQCSSFDRNGSGEVEITELIQGVNAALNGCAS